jgi:hypothetical protein
MRMVGRLADKLLNAVVPQISAGACCTHYGEISYKDCSCVRKGVGKRRTCVVSCFCMLTCSACQEFPNPACT